MTKEANMEDTCQGDYFNSVGVKWSGGRRLTALCRWTLAGNINTRLWLNDPRRSNSSMHSQHKLNESLTLFNKTFILDAGLSTICFSSLTGSRDFLKRSHCQKQNRPFFWWSRTWCRTAYIWGTERREEWKKQDVTQHAELDSFRLKYCFKVLHKYHQLVKPQ